MRDVHDRQEADDGVESLRRQRVLQRIAAHMGHLVCEAAAPRQVEAHAVQLGLQLKRRDMAARRVSEEAGRATDARTDVEHATRWTEA